MAGPAQTEMLTQEFWDARYGSRDELWSGAPNPRLVEHASQLGVGRALDVGCGEGADAIWLAERTWRVTALDVSPVALARGARRAAAVGADVAWRIDWLHEDLLTWAGPEPASYDLVSAQFVHLPEELREPLFGRLAAAVAPGGTLLIVGHRPPDGRAIKPGGPPPGLFYSAAEFAAPLDERAWEIVVAAALERSDTHHGHTHDVVLRAHRRH